MELAILILVAINLVISGTLSIILIASAIRSYVYDELDNCNYYGEEKDRL